MAEVVRLGMIGAGIVATEHIAAIKATPTTQLVGLVAGTPAETAQRAAAWQTRAYPDSDALLADPVIEAVLIVSPTPLHYVHARQAVSAGKHVLIEKPVTETVAQMHDLIALVERSGVLCMPGHNNLYYAPLQQARALIARGDLGDVIYANFSSTHYIPSASTHGWRTQMAQEGAFADSGVHQAYQAHYCLGLPHRVTALMAKLHYRGFAGLFDDIAVVTAQYPSGALSTIMQSWAAEDRTASPWVLAAKVLGQRGGIWIDERDQMAAIDGAVVDLNPERVPFLAHRFRDQLAHFVAALRGGPPPLSTLRDALACQRVIDAAYASARRGQTVELTTDDVP